MTLVHSTTKGLAAVVLALLHSRQLLDYDERVAFYWPEFAQAGKEHITVRQLLAHQAGLFAFDERVDADVVADLDRLAGVMERQRPIWPPGERQAYHAITLGFYENELVRRIDPAHRTIGQLLQEDIASPLDVEGEVYIGTPSSVPDERLAALVPPGLWARLTSMPPRFMIDALWPRSVLHRSLVANPGTSFYVDPEHVIVRELEVPSGGAVTTARALATAYGAFAAPGGPLALRPETLDALSAPALPARHGHDDRAAPRAGRGPVRAVMDLPRLFTIRESSHRIHNPLTEAKLATLGEALQLAPGTQALDLASGSGEMLCTWARDHGIGGTGVDISTAFTEKARARAAELGVVDRVVFVHGDASGYVAAQPVDLAACVGATWIGNGLAGTTELLDRSLRPGGIMLIGEPYWRRTPPDEETAQSRPRSLRSRDDYSVCSGPGCDGIGQ